MVKIIGDRDCTLHDVVLAIMDTAHAAPTRHQIYEIMIRLHCDKTFMDRIDLGLTKGEIGTSAAILDILLNWKQRAPGEATVDNFQEHLRNCKLELTAQALDKKFYPERYSIPSTIPNISSGSTKSPETQKSSSSECDTKSASGYSLNSIYKQAISLVSDTSSVVIRPHEAIIQSSRPSAEGQESLNDGNDTSRSSKNVLYDFHSRQRKNRSTYFILQIFLHFFVMFVAILSVSIIYYLFSWLAVKLVSVNPPAKALTGTDTAKKDFNITLDITNNMKEILNFENQTGNHVNEVSVSETPQNKNEINLESSTVSLEPVTSSLKNSKISQTENEVELESNTVSLEPVTFSLKNLEPQNVGNTRKTTMPIYEVNNFKATTIAINVTNGDELFDVFKNEATFNFDSITLSILAAKYSSWNKNYYNLSSYKINKLLVQGFFSLEVLISLLPQLPHLYELEFDNVSGELCSQNELGRSEIPNFKNCSQIVFQLASLTLKGFTDMCSLVIDTVIMCLPSHTLSNFNYEGVADDTTVEQMNELFRRFSNSLEYIFILSDLQTSRELLFNVGATVDMKYVTSIILNITRQGNNNIVSKLLDSDFCSSFRGLSNFTLVGGYMDNEQLDFLNKCRELQVIKTNIILQPVKKDVDYKVSLRVSPFLRDVKLRIDFVTCPKPMVINEIVSHMRNIEHLKICTNCSFHEINSHKCIFN